MLTEEESYNRLSQFYDEKFKKGYMGEDGYRQWSHSSPQLTRILETIRHVPANSSQILDYGCGQGAWIGVLSARWPQAQIYGIDVSEVAIKKAQLNFQQYTFTVFNGREAPFPDEFFDLVYAYHILEHVPQIEQTIGDICRLSKKGGYACIIFPCGNNGSFEDRVMKLMRGGIQPTSEGRKVHFYETAVGHLRRMSSDETIKLFEERGLRLELQFYSNQFIGWVEWLARGHDRSTIKSMLNCSKAVSPMARLKLLAVKKSLLILNWTVGKAQINLSKKRNPLKAIVALMAKTGASSVDRLLVVLAIFEWHLLKRCRSGSAQFLVFRKPSD